MFKSGHNNNSYSTKIRRDVWTLNRTIVRPFIIQQTEYSCGACNLAFLFQRTENKLRTKSFTKQNSGSGCGTGRCSQNNILVMRIYGRRHHHHRRRRTRRLWPRRNASVSASQTLATCYYYIHVLPITYYSQNRQMVECICRGVFW